MQLCSEIKTERNETKRGLGSGTDKQHKMKMAKLDRRDAVLLTRLLDLIGFNFLKSLLVWNWLFIELDKEQLICQTFHVTTRK